MIARYKVSGVAEEAEKSALVFKRKWEYYLAYCEAAFREKILNNVIIGALWRSAVVGIPVLYGLHK